MFSVKQVNEDGFEKLVLQDEAGGGYCEVIPGCGGTLHAFGAKSGGKTFQVVDHYDSGEQFASQVESLGFKSCKLAPYVCRLRDSTYSFGGETYKIKNNSALHALHGLLYKKSFSVINTVANDQHASVTLSYRYDQEDTGYPFVLDCIVTYELTSLNKLHLRTEYINHSDGLIPLQDGWHPYFTLGKEVDELELEFQSKHRLAFDEQLMPSGEKVRDDSFDTIAPVGSVHLDNCYELDMQECQPLCVLRNKEAKFEVQFYPKASYPYLQVYTPPHRNSIAIENLSGPPNGFNLGYGYATLEPGQSAVFETAYQISFLNH